MMNFNASMAGNGSSYGAYRKSKMIIDLLNVVLTLVIVVLFAALLLLGDRRGVLFPLIFAVGGVDNALASAKGFMSGRKLGGIVLALIAAGLFFLALAGFRLGL
jgi:hypothetical protein